MYCGIGTTIAIPIQGTTVPCDKVNEKILCIKMGHIGIVEKVQETSLGTGMHNRAITVLHELWMCLGKHPRDITLCNLVTI